MAIFSTNTLTQKGTELIATALANAQAIEFTGLAIGDGAAPENPESLTALVNKVMDVDISKAYIAPAEQGTTTLRASFQNTTAAAFYFREAGIFARLKGTTNEPILYGYTNAGETADLIDTVEEGSLLMQTLLCSIVTGTADVHIIDNPSALLTRQDLLEYLPLTGGTMSGDILANKSALYLKQTIDNGELSLLGGVSTVSGGGFYAYGGEHESCAGWFRARASKGGKYAELIGSPDGKLYWQGNDIITSAGGNLNGTFVHRSYSQPVLQCKTTDAQGNEVLGATLYLFPSNNDFKGGFTLRAVKPDGTYVELYGTNDGALTWNGQNVVTDMSSWGIPDYTAEIVQANGTTYTAECRGWVRAYYRNGEYQKSTLTINGIEVVSESHSGGVKIPGTHFYPVEKGSIYSTTGMDKLSFFPSK